MSSDDSGFDKEAEREKLREKYERDKRDRENTQRMSELLLQGATMTGKHCGDCGDPIFRYDGQEFCPTCQREVGGDGANEQAQSAQSENGQAVQSDDAQSPRADAESTTADDPAEDSAESDGEPRVEINDVRVADRHADWSDLRDPPSQRDGRTGGRQSAGHRHGTHDHGTHDHASRRGPQRRSADSDRSRPTPESAPERGPAADDLGAARASLVRTLTDLSRRAEETDDVARTRDLLSATREAAEALAALDRANR